MNDEPAPSPESKPPRQAAPRGRRIPNIRPAKPAKPAKPAEAAPGFAPVPVADPEVSVVDPEVPAAPPSPDDWPEPEPASSGTAGTPENPKRKRRRKKSKGNMPHGPAHNAPSPTPGEGPASPMPPESITAPTAAPPPKSPAPQPKRPPHLKIDPTRIAKRAWKIYLAEISEEGVALVGESEAKELSRRCFRLAEIFLEEQARRL